MKYLILTLIGLSLTGCGAKVIASTHKQVMVGNVTAYNMDDALEVAQKECEKHNKDAVFVPVDLGYDVAGYSCVNK